MEKTILLIVTALGSFLSGVIQSGLDKLEVAVQANELTKKLFTVVIDAVKDWEPKNPT